jgi:uncharacterized coiled-coil protein SlyX
MEDIPIGFSIKMGDRDILSNISNISAKDNIEDTSNINNIEFSSIGMRIFNPITSADTIGYTNRETVTKYASHERNQIAHLESKLAETESKLSQLQQVQSVTESRLNQTNAILNDCLNRLAKLEKLSECS